MNTAVVGIGYGDEGKGLLVDALCRRYDVDYGVRYCGGSQAGHTVVTPEGKRREFHGLCAGTYAGVKTVFLRDFIVNPYKLSEEIRELESEGVKVEIYVEPLCRVTTIYDMVINAIAETVRGNDRHGSCGMGINETIVRNSYGNEAHSAEFDVSTVFCDPYPEEGFAEAVFLSIKENWVPHRIQSLGIEMSQIPEPYLSIINEDPSKHAMVFEELMRFVCTHCKDSLNWKLRHAWASTVFESSQGLLLDQRYGFFPHCTPGLVGCKDIPCHVSNCVYVTRAYASRHGAGPLPYEGQWMNFDDYTNVDNEWQGTIRYAPLDVDRLRVAVTADISKAPRSNYLAVTHFDQVPSEVLVYHHCKPKSIPVEKFSDWLCDALGLDGVLCESHGPCSDDIAWRDIDLRGLTLRGAVDKSQGKKSDLASAIMSLPE